MTDETRPRGAKPLIDAFASALRGELPTVPPDVPPHLQEQEYRFVCDCGTNWRQVTSARVDQGKVVPPTSQCVSCRTWVPGHLLPSY
jgi:hypothetical protein